MRPVKIQLKKALNLPATALVIVVIISALAFTNGKNISKKQSNQIMVGIGYKSEKCGSASFSKAVCYMGYSTTAAQGYSDVSDFIKTSLNRNYGVSDNNVSISSSYKSMAVIIKYEKEMVGWNCSQTRYAAGFGDTTKEATDDAIGKKDNDDPSSKWLYVTRIYK
jgi:hypothetical protein